MTRSKIKNRINQARLLVLDGWNTKLDHGESVTLSVLARVLLKRLVDELGLRNLKLDLLLGCGLFALLARSLAAFLLVGSSREDVSVSHPPSPAAAQTSDAGHGEGEDGTRHESEEGTKGNVMTAEL